MKTMEYEDDEPCIMIFPKRKGNEQFIVNGEGMKGEMIIGILEIYKQTMINMMVGQQIKKGRERQINESMFR